jgi:hypothetical protein
MMRGSHLSREDKMRAIASLIAAVGMLSVGTTVAAAMPADGAAIARLAQQVDAVVVVKKGKKSKTGTTGTPTPPPRQPNQSY